MAMSCTSYNGEVGATETTFDGTGVVSDIQQSAVRACRNARRLRADRDGPDDLVCDRADHQHVAIDDVCPGAVGAERHLRGSTVDPG